MAGNYYTPFPIRMSEELIAKVKVIAAYNKQSTSKEIVGALERHVADWEQRHGKIVFPDEKE